MKTHVQNLSLHSLLCLMVFFLGSCNDDDEQKTIPKVTTGEVTNVATTSATGGGEIVSDGNSTITTSGLAYSSTNAMPTIADIVTEETAVLGIFTSQLEPLISGTTYYVRAYATNSVGTGYGDVVTFNTSNAAPMAVNVGITGTAQVSETLTASYNYEDVEGDVESGTVVQWYRANGVAGAGETAIEDATELSYTLQPIDEFKYIRVGITPNAAAGTANGIEAKSEFVGPVAEEPNMIVFTYNGKVVTYGIIISPTTGRRWLDRNLGAHNSPIAYNDYANYGDLFQWGRVADGHQLINRGQSNTETTAVNGTTTTISNSDVPGHGLFIVSSSDANFDWRNPNNDNLWSGINRINNPCPIGWHIPDSTEWAAEKLLDINDANLKLKLTLGGNRSSNSGNFAAATIGNYWTTSIPASANTRARIVLFTSTGVTHSTQSRALAASCRCIKD